MLEYDTEQPYMMDRAPGAGGSMVTVQKPVNPSRLQSLIEF